MEKDNNDCLVIFQCLSDSFKHIEDKIEPDVNLFAVFFHHLMIILSGYVLKINELKGPFKPSDIELNIKYDHFPYLSYEDIINGIDLASKDFSFYENKISSKRKLVSISSKMGNQFRKKREVALLPNFPFSRSDIFFFIKNGISINYINNFSINIDMIESQLKVLKDCIDDIFDRLNILKSSNSINELIKRHINERVTSKKITIKNDLIIGGGMGELENCFYAAISKQMGNEFISVMHGEGDQLLFDEPFFGYGERSLPSILFGFGKGGKFINERNYFWKSLYDQPKYITSNSNFIKSNYANKRIKELTSIDKMKWLYVPDSYSYTKRTGPYGGSISSNIYFIWQKNMIGAFKNIIYKKHPKGHYLYKKLSKNNLLKKLSVYNKDLKIIDENFLQIYNDYDGYIFDHISTAMMVSISTNKPIIYFNIGKRNLSHHVIKMIKERCIWIDIDPLNPGDLREKLEFYKNSNFNNNITLEFSLDIDNLDLSRRQKLLQIIKSLI